MADPPDSSLELEYAATTARVRRFLLSEFDLTVMDKSAPGYPPYPNRWREVWQVPVAVSSKEHTLLIAIPKTFPDQLPIVYLPHEVKEGGRTIPHQNREREFCTFDKTEVRLNADNPEGIALRVIERATKLLEEGVTGANKGDYLDEFEAYWEQVAKTQALSLVAPSEEARRILVLRLNPSWKDWPFLFTDDEAAGKRWLKSVGYKNKPTVDHALYLPLRSFGLPPYPVNNGELYDRLKEEDPDALRQLLDFLQKRPRPSCVLFSVPAGGTRRAMGAWWHPKHIQHHSKGAKKDKSSKGISDGAAPATNTAEYELAVQNRKSKLLGATIARVDHERLSIRTAGYSKGFEYPVNVIGCGSIGSHAASRLAETGVASKIRLIDFEQLSIENIARHYCGMSDVGEFKTVATAAKIGRHFPHIEVETKQSEILDLLRTSPTLITPASLTLVAVGELSVERRLNRLSMAADSPPPYCYVWVEPHLYAGHAVFVRKGGGGCFECAFDENFLFRQRVIADTRSFSMREAGCRSTYVPYSGLYANEFASALTRFLLSVMNAAENQIFSWTGDLDLARHDGVALAGEWEAAPSFSSFVRPLTMVPTCPVCAT